MAQSRLLGIHIPTSTELVADFGTEIQQTVEDLETYLVGKFPNAAARDAAWALVPAGPVGGARCWLGSPAGNYTFWPGGLGWLPDAMPRSGDSSTFARSQVAASDATWVTPDFADFGCAQTFPIPSWARDFGGQAQIMAWVHASVDAGGDGAATKFSLGLRYSRDGGQTFDGGSPSGLGGPNVSATATVAAQDSPNTLDVSGVTNIQCQIMVRSRLSGAGTLRRVGGNSKVVWLAVFTRGA